MPYLGNHPTANFATVTKDTFNGNASSYTLSKPATTNGVAVYVENVRQIPTTAYSVSGTTLTFTGTTPAGTNNVYVMHHNTPVSTATHPAAQDLTAANATLTGDVTVTGASTFNGTVAGTAMTLLNTTTVSSAVASVTFSSSLITDAYMDYKVTVRHTAPVTNGQALTVFPSDDNGSNYDILIEQAMAYHDLKSTAQGQANTVGNSSAKINIGTGTENTANKGLNADVYFIGLRNTTGIKAMYYNCIGIHDLDGGHNTGNDYWWDGAAKIIGSSNTDRTAINNLKFAYVSGNVAQGTFSLYGIKS